MATDLGKITITMEGEYDPEKEYERLCCVRYMRATWVSTQTTLGNEPTDTSEFWKKISDDGYTSTVVKYNVQIPISLWRESTAHEGYGYEASFSIEGITAASICSIIFDLEEVLTNNFAPVCESYYGGITIYAKRLPTKVVKISSIRADKYYNQDDLIPDSVKNDVNQNIDNLATQLDDITDNVLDVQNSTMFIQNILVPSTGWKQRNDTFTTDTYTRFAEIRIEDYITIPEKDDFESQYTATVIFNEANASSQLYSPVVETLNAGDLNLGNGEYKVIKIFAKENAINNDINIPLIKLEKVSISTLKKNEVNTEDSVEDENL